MIVANGVTGDSRVQKAALAASRAGYRVTVVGLSRDGARSVEQLEDVPVIRVPVVFAETAAAKRAIKAAGEAARGDGDRASGTLAGKPTQARTAARRLADRLATSRRTQRTSMRLRSVALDTLLKLSRLGVRRADEVIRWRGRQETLSNRDTVTGEKLFRAKLSDFKRDYLEELAQLDFDLVHAHDFTMIECARAAVTAASGTRRRPAFVYDAHEWVRGLTHLPSGTQAASIAAEQENIRAADAVLTVSPVLRDRLREEHSLSENPSLVLNAPLAATYDPDSHLSVREQAGVDSEVPLAVYGGAVKESRGIVTLIRALTLVPELHLAIVASTSNASGVKEVVAEAEALACSDRVHVVSYVSYDQVSNYLRSADLGVHPLLPSGNAELALPNKVFEYLHAGLPMVVSNMPSMSQLVSGHGWGEVFTAGDHQSLAKAIRRVLSEPETYRAAVQDPDARREFSWEHQAETLIATYDRLIFEGSLTDGAQDAVRSGRTAAEQK